MSVSQVHQDARLYAGLFDGTERATLPLRAGRMAYVHVATGALNVNGTHLSAGDALRLTDEALLELADGQQAHVLVFDLPGE